MGDAKQLRPKCLDEGCAKTPSFNFPGEKRAMCCVEHKKKGMVNVYGGRCSHEGCPKQPSFNFPGWARRVCCGDHKVRSRIAYSSFQIPDSFIRLEDLCVFQEEGMVHVAHATCAHADCDMRPMYNFAGKKGGACCALHREDGMVDISTVRYAKCDQGCGKNASYNFPGVKGRVRCREHRIEGMVDVSSSKCGFEGCPKKRRFNYLGMKPALFCATHKVLQLPDSRFLRPPWFVYNRIIM